MKRINAIFVFVIAFAVFASVSGVASAATNDHLFFGSPENLSELNVTKVTGTAPSEGHSLKTIRYEIDAAECSIHPVLDAQGYVYLKIADLKPCTKPGEPQPLLRLSDTAGVGKADECAKVCAKRSIQQW